MFLALAGNIASGKTSLTKLLSEKFCFKPYYESVMDNPYLKDFYSDMSSYSLKLQMYFLNSRFKQHKEIVESGNSSIQDRTIYEDAEVFSRNLFLYNYMSERDYILYKDLFEQMKKFLRPPDIIVYLKSSTEMLLRRIKLRGRSFEENISEDYLKKLNDRYDDWISSITDIKVITIYVNEFDFILNPNDFNYLCNKIISSFDQGELFFKEAEKKFDSPNIF